jgi:hypothetical protein
MRALRVDEAVPLGPISLAMGHTGPVLFSSVAWPRQAECALCVWPALRFWPSGRFKLENPFSICFGFSINSNFENLYLNIQSSKNYEISSVGFIIFYSIQ